MVRVYERSAEDGDGVGWMERKSNGGMVQGNLSARGRVPGEFMSMRRLVVVLYSVVTGVSKERVGRR